MGLYKIALFIILLVALIKDTPFFYAVTLISDMPRGISYNS